MLRESGILMISIINIVIVTAVFLDVFKIVIPVSVGTSSRFNAELKAASSAQKKNRPPKIIPYGICEQIFGMVINNRAGPEFISISKEKIAGIITSVARIDAAVLKKIVQKDALGMSESFDRYEPYVNIPPKLTVKKLCPSAMIQVFTLNN